MRILHVIHGFPPYNMAGSEVYTYNLAKELAKQHEVFIFHRIADPGKEEYKVETSDMDGFKVYTINNTFRDFKTFEDTYMNATIRIKFGEVLEQIKPNIVHFGHATCLSTDLIEEAKKRGLPVVYTIHDYWLICPRGQFIKRDFSMCNGPEDVECVKCMAQQLNVNNSARWVSRFIAGFGLKFISKNFIIEKAVKSIYKRFVTPFFAGQKYALHQIRERTVHIKEMCSLVDLFIAPSRFLKQKYIEYGIPESKIIYSDYGFNYDYFKDFKKKESDKLRFGYIGTLIPSKGVHLLIQAFNKIDAHNSELKIYGTSLPVHGISNYGEYLRSLVRNRNIKFMGHYHNSDIGKVLSEIDVLVVPSIWFENSPLTIHEALMAGIPVITGNVGGMAELIEHGRNGLLFALGDHNDLFKKIKLMIDQPSMIQQLSKGISQIKTIREDSAEISKIYNSLKKGNYKKQA